MTQRIIKFRAWFENKMYQVTSISLDNQYYSWSHGDEGPIPLGTKSNLMQFTGLHDKNGTEIYEGDIVHIEDKRRTPLLGTDENKPIVFDGGAFRFDGMNLAEMMGWGGYPAAITYEIIGNIYQNPNLIK